MYEVIFVFVVIFTAVYLCLRRRRRLLEARLQEHAEARANGSDGLVAVRINNDWYLFSRAAAPPGHEQAGVPLGPVVAGQPLPDAKALLVAQPDGEMSVALEDEKAKPAAGQAASRDVPHDPAWSAADEEAPPAPPPRERFVTLATIPRRGR